MHLSSLTKPLWFNVFCLSRNVKSENRIDGFELLIYFGVVVMFVDISMLAVNWFSFILDYVQLLANTSHQPLNQHDHLAIGRVYRHGKEVVVVVVG